MNYTKISRELLASIEFRLMDESDKMGFAGVTSPCPMLGEVEAEGITVIVDGGYAELYAYDGCANFDCIDTCENINELPYKSARQIEIEESIKRMKAEIETLENVLKTEF